MYACNLLSLQTSHYKVVPYKQFVNQIYQVMEISYTIVSHFDTQTLTVRLTVLLEYFDFKCML